MDVILIVFVVCIRYETKVQIRRKQFKEWIDAPLLLLLIAEGVVIMTALLAHIYFIRYSGAADAHDNKPLRTVLYWSAPC